MSQQLSNERHEEELLRLEISAFFDGECEVDAACQMARKMSSDEAMRAKWRAYALIGDRLRGTGSEAVDITVGVMRRLRAEPIVLAPRRIAGRKPHPFMALAASLFGVAVVGWLAWSDSPAPVRSTERLAAVAPASNFSVANRTLVAPVRQVQPAPAAAEVDEYLLAHHMQAVGMRLGDGTERVHTITYVVGAGRP